MTNKIKHVFFDLDNTLWDFEKNSTEILYELFDKYELKKLGVLSPEYFITMYKDRNAMMWEQYRHNKIDKATLRNKRFYFTFWDMGLEPETVPEGLAEDYVRMSPAKKNLFPNTIEVLDYLFPKYKLHILTNGFAEAQHVKLQNCGIEKYFTEVIISEETGFKKPDINIFKYAMLKTNSTSDENIMIGDGFEVDTLGAMNAGWKGVFFNIHHLKYDVAVDYEIKNLIELKSIL